MVKFKVHANPSGQYYFPQEVREELGRELVLLCNAKAAVIFNTETSLNIVLESLALICKDIEHRLRLQTQEQSCKAV